jgi:hypothetical protein
MNIVNVFTWYIAIVENNDTKRHKTFFCFRSLVAQCGAAAHGASETVWLRVGEAIIQQAQPHLASLREELAQRFPHPAQRSLDVVAPVGREGAEQHVEHPCPWLHKTGQGQPFMFDTKKIHIEA